MDEMTQSRLFKFNESVRYWLVRIGCEDLTEDKRKCVILKHVDELIYLPGNFKKFINIYYTKDGQIIDVYRSQTNAGIRRLTNKFIKYHLTRNLHKILENDDSTKAYI